MNRRTLKKYRDDFVAFAEDALGIMFPYWQKILMRKNIYDLRTTLSEADIRKIRQQERSFAHRRAVNLLSNKMNGRIRKQSMLIYGEENIAVRICKKCGFIHYSKWNMCINCYSKKKCKSEVIPIVMVDDENHLEPQG